MSVKDAWKASGLVTLTLPSGFRVRGVLPAPSEVVRRKIVPQALRQAVIPLGGRLMTELSEDEHAMLVDARRFQAAAFIKEMAAPGTTGDDGWEPVAVTKDELEAMPGRDVEALDDLIGGYATADVITARAEVALGLRDPSTLADIEEREAGDTVDGWRGFRDGDGGDARHPSGADVEPSAIGNPPDHEPADRVRGRRRARAAGGRRTTGSVDGQVASA